MRGLPIRISFCHLLEDAVEIRVLVYEPDEILLCPGGLCGERVPAGAAVVHGGAVDGMTPGAFPGLQGGSPLLLLGGKAIGLQNGPVDVLAGHVEVSRKHLRGEGSPHHLLDYTLLDSRADQVSDGRVPEDMGGDLLLDPSSLGDAPDLLIDSLVGEMPLPFREKDRLGVLRVPGVIGLPRRKVGDRCYEPDPSGFLGYLLN